MKGCGQVVERKGLLSKHMQVDHSKKCYPCKLCEKKFVSRKTWRKHVSQHKNKCDVCDLRNFDDDELKVHTVRFHILSCDSCDNIFRTTDLLTQHFSQNHSVEAPFSCDFCSKLFAKQDSLKKHIEEHHNLVCEQCIQVFQTKLELFQHLSNIHDIRKKLKCEFCEIKLLKQNLLYKHILQAHNWECDQVECDRIFKSEKLLIKHQNIDHLGVTFTEDFQFKCEICFVTYKNPSLLEKHISTFHVLKCQHCDKQFSSHALLVQHMDEDHSIPRSFDCETCERLFATKDRLRLHILKHHTFKCDHCPNIYKSEDPLIHHVAMDHSDIIGGRYKCDYCSETCETKLLLENHILDQHSCKCGYCDDIFIEESKYIDHMRRIHSIIPSKIPQFSNLVNCDLCEITIGATYSLRRHYEECHKDKVFLYNCVECSAGFRANCLLENHLRIHRQTEEYELTECRICFRVFHHVQTHKAHFLKAHPDSEFKLQYKCIECEEVFVSRLKVRKHMRSFHNRGDGKEDNYQDEEGFECDSCEDVFGSADELEMHMKSHIKCESFLEVIEIDDEPQFPQIKNELDTF